MIDFSRIWVQADLMQEVSVLCDCGWKYNADYDHTLRTMSGWPTLESILDAVDAHHIDTHLVESKYD